MSSWTKGVVLEGDKSATQLGYPSLNLDPKILNQQLKEGVYAAEVKIKNKKYFSVLFYGPRLVKKETNNVLEIHVLNFNKNIYGQVVTFKTVKLIREVMNFKSTDALKQQIANDIKQASDFLSRKKLNEEKNE